MKKIKLDPNNTRKHGDKNKNQIRESFEKNGAGRSVLIDSDGILIAGNGAYEQAEKLGVKTRIVETDGTELVIVKRTDLKYDDPKRRRLAIADNATAESSKWDFEELTPQEVHEWGIVAEEDDEEDYKQESAPREKREIDNSVNSEKLEEYKELAGYSTAISRTDLSAPMAFYQDQGFLTGEVLDYGGGKEVHEYNIFDPAWKADYELLDKKYDTVTCNYVINVIPLDHNRFELIRTLQTLINEDGKILLSIYGAEDHDTVTARGYQCGWSKSEWKEFLKKHAKVKEIKAPFWAFEIKSKINGNKQ